jgi:hypothetical protein
MNYSSKVDEYNKQVHGLEKKDYSELVERWRRWWTASGQNCSKTGECMEVTKARLQFQEMGKKRASGRYQIDFEEHHLEGEYKVKYRHKGKPCMCE